MDVQPLASILLLAVIPLWLLAGPADWFCHRASAIERNAGAKEAALHLLMLAEVALPLAAGLLLEINALVLVLALVCWAVHEATAFWDLHHAVGRRDVTAFEQHVHSYLGVLPLLALVSVVSLHWGQFVAIFGSGGAADWTPR